MPADDLHQRLSSISTLWSVLHQAHAGSGTEATAAQQLLLRRYGRAVHRYLLAAVRDNHAAEELTQEFGLYLVRGSFRAADPQRGRFRDYIKSVLFHLVSKYRQDSKKNLAALPPDSPLIANLAAPPAEAEQEFDQVCREEALTHAWDALADVQPAFYAVLRFRATHKMPSGEMAKQLSEQLGKPFTADSVRQTLHRARELYEELLVEAVASTLTRPTPEQVEEELRDLNLLKYCERALARWRRCRPDG